MTKELIDLIEHTVRIQPLWQQTKDQGNRKISIMKSKTYFHSLGSKINVKYWRNHKSYLKALSPHNKLYRETINKISYLPVIYNGKNTRNLNRICLQSKDADLHSAPLQKNKGTLVTEPALSPQSQTHRFKGQGSNRIISSRKMKLFQRKIKKVRQDLAIRQAMAFIKINQLKTKSSQ